MFTIQLWRGSFSFIFNSHFLSVVLEFFIFFIFIFISLDRCSIPSREGSILWSYLDITLLFSSYVYLIFYSIKGKFFGVGIFVSGVSTRSSILVQHERCNDHDHSYELLREYVQRFQVYVLDLLLFGSSILSY